MLLRRPTLSTAVILTVALGVGMVTAIFAAVEAVLLRPLPYDDPDRLVMVWQTNELSEADKEWNSVPDFFDLERSQKSFEELAGFRPTETSLHREGTEPVRAPLGEVTHDFFPLLGVTPAVGRGFLPEEDRPGAGRALILDHDFWISHFGGDPDVLGQAVLLDEVPYEVVGVLPPTFVSPADGEQEGWVPLAEGPDTGSRDTHELRVFGRLSPGASIAQAEDDLGTIMRRLEERYAETNAGRGIRVVSLREELVGDVRTAILVVFAAGGLMLIVALVTVVNLLLARAAERTREMAVRSAVGSSRKGLVACFLTETLVLVGLGGAVGLALAAALLRFLVAAGDDRIPRLAAIDLNVTVLLFACALTLAVGVVSALVPALRIARGDLTAPLREGATSLSGRRESRFRKVLVVSEVAVALVLVIGASLLIKSYLRLQAVELGFEPENVLTMNVPLPESRYVFPSFDVYPEWPELSTLNRRLLERIRAVPGVEHAAIAMNHPLNPGWTTTVTFPRQEGSDAQRKEEVTIRAVTPEYFQATETKLLQGRSIRESDGAATPPVVVVNRAFVRRYLTGDPVSQRIAFWSKVREIVGVVKDVRFLGPGADVPPAIYPPFEQAPMASYTLVVKTEGEPSAVLPDVRRAVWSEEPAVAVYDAQTMEERLARALARPRFNAQLLVLFAGVSVLLSATGVYGLVSHAVLRRTPEIGIRLAFGGTKADVFKMITREALGLVLGGVAVGLIVAWIATRALGALLYGVSVTDATVYAGVPLLLLLVGFLASLLPSVRAVRIDPSSALKYE